MNMKLVSGRVCVAILLPLFAACGGGGGGGGSGPAPVSKSTLTVTVSGNGTVASAPAGIAACGPTSGTCSAEYDKGTVVVLTATPGSGATLRGWSGGCTRSTTVPTQCTATVNSATSVIAVFDPTVVGGGTGDTLVLTRSGKLLTFDRATPGTISSLATVGVPAGETMLAMDYRPSNGLLYGVARKADGQGRLYIIDEGSADAILIAELAATGADLLDATWKYEMSFEPGPGAEVIRLVADTGAQSGKVYTLGPDGNAGTLSGVNQASNASVGSLAFTNAFRGTRFSSGFGIDTDTTPDRLKRLASGSAATFADVVNLGVAVNDSNGFAIDGETGVAYVAFRSASTLVPTLYTLNLATGALASVGQIGDGTVATEEIASLVVPQPAQPQVFGIFEGWAQADIAPAGFGTGTSLVRFNATSPSAVVQVADLAATGLPASVTVRNLAVRPSSNVLYALGSDDKLYTVSTLNGAVSPACSGATIAGLDEAVDPVGFDFNPLNDQIRISGGTLDGEAASSLNLLINPDTCAAITPALALLKQTPFEITSVAFINNTTASQQSTPDFYGIDSQSNQLFKINAGTAPNTASTNGRLSKVADLSGVTATGIGGFEIGGTTNTAYMTVTDGTNSFLYTVPLASGAATLVKRPSAASAIGSTSAFSGKLVGLTSQATTGSAPAVLFAATDDAAPNARLIAFDPNVTATNGPDLLLSNLPITGLATGEKILALEYRYATNTSTLYALVRGADGTSARLYSLVTSAATATATAVGTVGMGNIMSGPAPYVLEGTNFGMDSDPATGNLRIVSDANENLSVAISPLAATVTVASDIAQTPFPAVNALTYTHNVFGSASSTLFLFDANAPDSDRLMTVDSTQTVSRGKASGIDNAATDYVGLDVVGGHDGLALATEATCDDPFCTSSAPYTEMWFFDMSTGVATDTGSTVGGDGDLPFEDSRMLIRTLAIRFP